MKISLKLSVLIAAAALLAVSLYGLIAYRAWSDIQFQRLLNHGRDYTQPLRSLGDAVYKNQLAALDAKRKGGADRKSTRLNSSHSQQSRMPSSA